jgi:hypothetical protein
MWKTIILEDVRMRDQEDDVRPRLLLASFIFRKFFSVKIQQFIAHIDDNDTLYEDPLLKTVSLKLKNYQHF